MSSSVRFKTLQLRERQTRYAKSPFEVVNHNCGIVAIRYNGMTVCFSSNVFELLILMAEANIFAPEVES